MSGEVIAIDGPSASGKSTVARSVAAALGMLYVDSGALYRGVTHAVLVHGADPADSEAVVDVMRDADFSFVVSGGAVGFLLGGVDVSEAIRDPCINSNVSAVAAVGEVRRQITSWLRDMRRHGGLVMEGRDIGTIVFPDAKHKFYLNASEAERARRRHAELAGKRTSVDEVDQSLRRRDALDSTRKMAPLRTAPGAVVIDTTGLSIDDVVRRIVAYVEDAA